MNIQDAERNAITKLQEEAMDKIHKIARDANIEYILICDEDIFGRLEDEPEKLAKLDHKMVSVMKDDIVSELGEAFCYAVDNAINNNL